MHTRRGFGDAVAHSLGLQDVPVIRTQVLRRSQVGISRLSIGADQLGMTPQIPPEDTFIVATVPHGGSASRVVEPGASGHFPGLCPELHADRESQRRIFRKHHLPARDVGFLCPPASP